VSVDLRTVVAPSSVAILGASNDPDRIGGKFLWHLLKQGYQGKVYPINPKYTELFGRQCYPGLQAISDPVEHAVILMGKDRVMAALAECRAKGVRAATIIASGYAEVGTAEGRAAQKELERFARESGIRLVGPNCWGLINLLDNFCPTGAAVVGELAPMPAGNLALITQSAGVGQGSVLYRGANRGIDFGYALGVGNEADLHMADFLEYVIDDPRIDVIALVTEGFRDGPRFISLARRAALADKPIVILKVGRTELGARMASSHTGALTGSDAVADAVFRQYGVIRVDDYDELIDIAGLFAKLMQSRKLPRGDGVVAISVSGGHTALIGDLGEANGLRFPPMAEGTLARLRKILPGFGSFVNPLDLTAMAVNDPTFWRQCVETLMDDAAFDVVVPIITVARSYQDVIEDLIRLDGESEKPIVVLWAGGDFQGDGRKLLAQSSIPWVESPLRLIKGLRALADFRRHRERIARTTVMVEPPRTGAASVLREARAEGRRALTERESKDLLARAGLPVTRERLATTVEEAIAAAAEIGYPVALKVEAPDLLHKTEAGALRLNISNPRELAEAYEAIVASALRFKPDLQLRGVLVQEMVPGGEEVILGAKLDRTFGPVVMVGLGGVLVEVMQDVSMRVAPVTPEEARRMLDELKGAALLRGARGRPVADEAAVVDALVSLSRLAVELGPDLREIDVNPLIVLPAGQGARAADALIIV